MNYRRIAVTGSSGLIGKALKKELLKHKIEFIDINRNQWDLNKCMSNKDFDSVFKDVDAIIHLAAFVPNRKTTEEILTGQIFKSNVRSFYQLLCWHHKKNIPLVHISTSGIYANQNKRSIQEDDVISINKNSSSYMISKYTNEKMIEYFYPNYENIIIIRPSSVYGVGMKEDQMIIKFLRKCLDNDNFNIYSVNSTVNLLFAEDLARAIILSLNSKAFGIYNIADKKMFSISEIANACIEIIGKGKLNIIDKENNFRRYDLDISKAKNSFGYFPKNSLIDGLTKIKNKFEDYKNA